MNNKRISKKFLEAISLFNKEDFYGQHDILEELWIKLEKNDIRRMLYQGILNIGVGFYHFKIRFAKDNKNHLMGCEKQLKKGIKRLEQFIGLSVKYNFQLGNKKITFIWLSLLIEKTKSWLNWLIKTNNVEAFPHFPTIELDD